jgi:hypothetical protein
MNPYPLLFIGNALVIALFAIDFASLDHGLIQHEVAWGRDFVNVWTAGKANLIGKLDQLYDLHSYRAFQQTLFPGIGAHNYSYPPLGLPLTIPFALLPYGAALALWLAGTGWLFAKAAEPWWKEATGWPLILVLLTPAALINAWAGHYGFLLGALLLLGWRNLERGRPLFAGLCFGLMAIKPHLAILVPLILLLRCEWKALGAAAITVVSLIATSILFYGIGLWRDFFAITIGVQADMINAGGAFYGLMSTSVSTALFGLGLPKTLVTIVQLAAAATAISLVALAARRASLRDTALLASTATFLVLPYAFNYDLTVSAIAAAMIMGDTTLTPTERCVAQIGLVAAQLGMLLALLGAPVMPLLLLGLTIVQYRVAMRASARRAAPAGEAVAHSV